MDGASSNVQFSNLAEVLAEPQTDLRIFGKQEVNGHRRMAVILARDIDTDNARSKVDRAYKKLKITL